MLQATAQQQLPSLFGQSIFSPMRGNLAVRFFPCRDPGGSGPIYSEEKGIFLIHHGNNYENIRAMELQDMNKAKAALQKLDDANDKAAKFELNFCKAMSIFSKLKKPLFSIADPATQKELRELFKEHKKHRIEDREVLIKGAEKELEQTRSALEKTDSELKDSQSKSKTMQDKITQLEKFIEKEKGKDPESFLDRESDDEVINTLNRLKK